MGQSYADSGDVDAAWSSLPLSAKRVLIDIADAEMRSKLVNRFPVKSFVRLEFYALLMRRLKHATDKDLMEFFGLSRTMAYRIRRFDISRSFLLRLKYRSGIRRERIRRSLIDEAIKIIDLLLPIRSGKGYRLLCWDFVELYRRYREKAVSERIHLCQNHNLSSQGERFLEKKKFHEVFYGSARVHRSSPNDSGCPVCNIEYQEKISNADREYLERHKRWWYAQQSSYQRDLDDLRQEKNLSELLHMSVLLRITNSLRSTLGGITHASWW